MFRARNVLTAALVAFVATTAFADTTWDAVKKKAQGAKEYSCTYRYDGPQGNYKFDYRFAGDKIRTEIKESKSDASKVGTVLVYDAKWNKDKVRAKTGGGVIVRNTTHKDVQGRPFHQSLFGLIFEQIGSAAPTKAADGGKTRFDFKTGSGTYKVWANDSGEITKTERTDGRDKETREFSDLKWTAGSTDF